MQQALVLAALALVLAVAAVLLWRHANSGAPRREFRLPGKPAAARARRADRRGDIRRRGARGAQRFSWWDRLLLLAGLRHGAGLYLRIFAPIVAARCWPGPSWAPCPASSRCCY